MVRISLKNTPSHEFYTAALVIQGFIVKNITGYNRDNSTSVRAWDRKFMATCMDKFKFGTCTLSLN